MATQTDPSVSLTEVSLVRGGLFYRVEQTAGLIHPDRWDLGRRIIVLMAIGWLPLFLITAIWNWPGLPSLLTDYRVHARLLIAIPVLLLSEPLLESRLCEVFAHIRGLRLLDAEGYAYMNRVKASMVSARDSFLPEIAIVLLAILRTATAYKGVVDATPWLGRGAGADFHLTAAGWYGILVSTTLYEFLLGLSVWRWLLWTFFAFQLSRQKLNLVPTHPDEHGGLGFLGITSLAFAPVAFAVATVVGSNWRHEILYHGAHLMDFKLPAIALVALIVVFALGPLAFFVPRLAALRQRGILEYGILGQTSSTDFHAKWILHGCGDQAEFLKQLDSTSLNGFAQGFTMIEKLKPFPADKIALFALAAAIVIPALPVILAEIPIGVVLMDLFKALR